MGIIHSLCTEHEPCARSQRDQGGLEPANGECMRCKSSALRTRSKKPGSRPQCHTLLKGTMPKGAKVTSEINDDNNDQTYGIQSKPTYFCSNPASVSFQNGLQSLGKVAEFDQFTNMLMPLSYNKTVNTCERQQSYSVQMNQYRHRQILLAIFSTTCLKSHLDNPIVSNVR